MYRILFSIGKHILVHKIYFLCHNLCELLGNPWYRLSHLLAHSDLFFNVSPEEVSKLCRFPHEAWEQYLTTAGKFDKIWQDFTKSSLFVLTKNKARVILLSFSYLVKCSQLLKRCILFSSNSCLRNAPYSSFGWRLSLSAPDLLNFTQFQLVASSEPQKRSVMFNSIFVSVTRWDKSASK